MRQRGIVVALALTCAALGMAEAASASRIGLTYDGTGYGFEMTYEAEPGENNDVTHTASGGSPGQVERVTITDPGAVIEVPPGCESNGPHEVTCGADNPASEAHYKAITLANCALSLTLPDCDTEIRSRYIRALRLMLDDGANRYVSSTGSMPFGVTVVGGAGDDRFEVSGEQWASLGGGAGDDVLRVGTLVAGGPGNGQASVEGDADDDLIDVENGTPGDSLRCGDGADEVHADAGDRAYSPHGCESLPPGVIEEP